MKLGCESLLSVAFDYSWETFTARDWLRQMHPEDAGSFDEKGQWALGRRRVYRVEYRMRRADGGYIWWEERGAPAQFRDGPPARWVGVAGNITGRKQAEEELRRPLQEVQALKAELEAQGDPGPQPSA